MPNPNNPDALDHLREAFDQKNEECTARIASQPRLTQDPGVCLPILLGPSNLGHWSDILYQRLALANMCNQLEQHFAPYKPDDLELEIGEDVNQVHKRIRDKIQGPQTTRAGPETLTISEWKVKRNMECYRDMAVIWHENGLKIGLMIKGSLGNIRDRLVEAGWNPKIFSVKYHYDFIMEKVPEMTETAADPIRDYETRLDNLEKMCMCMAINGLENGPVKIELTTQFGSLSFPRDVHWDDLIQRIYAQTLTGIGGAPEMPTLRYQFNMPGYWG